jgi:hypothetical protein
MTVARIIVALIAALAGGMLALPIAIIAIPFWAMALMMRQCSRRWLPSATSWEGVIEFNQHAGWKPKPNLDAFCSFAAGTFHVKTDAHGWRGEGDIGQCDVLVLGDSVAFGFGVNDEDAFFSRVDSGAYVKAVGAPGYNMVQEVLWLEQLRSELKGKLVVWFICLGNDLYDNLIPNLYHYRMPFVRKQNTSERWEIVTGHVKKSPWPFNSENNTRLRDKWEATFTDRVLGQRAYSACEFLIHRGRDLCRENGADLVLMTVPIMNQLDQLHWKNAFLAFGGGQNFDPGLPDRKIGEICERLAVRFLAGRDYLEMRDHIEGDGHWNEIGHTRIAHLLLSLHKDHVLGRNSATARMQSTAFSAHSEKAFYRGAESDVA